MSAWTRRVAEFGGAILCGLMLAFLFAWLLFETLQLLMPDCGPGSHDGQCGLISLIELGVAGAAGLLCFPLLSFGSLRWILRPAMARFGLSSCASPEQTDATGL